MTIGSVDEKLTGAVERVHSLFVGGLEHMPVRLRRRRGRSKQERAA